MLHSTHWIVLAVVILPATGHAWDFTLWGRELNLSGTNTFNYTYFADNDGTDRLDGEVDDDFHRVFNTLDVNLTSGDVRLGARFDIYSYIDSPFQRLCPPGATTPQWCAQRNMRYIDHYGIYRRQGITPDRIYLTVARPELDLTLGDFYVSFGKGIALHVVKLDELGQDMAIRGGKLVIHHGELGLTFLAGEFNPLDTDEATGFVGDPGFPRRHPLPVQAPWSPDPIVAGRVEYRFFDAVLAGAHAVWIITDDPQMAGKPIARTDQELVWGATLELPSLLDGRLNISTEVDLQRTVWGAEVSRGPGATTDNKHAFSGPRGLAAYASSTLQLGQWTVTAEAKYYNDFLLRAAQGQFEPYALLYHQPPTLERVIAEVSDNVSTAGGHLRVDHDFGERGPLELTAFVSYGYFETRFAGEHSVHDPYAGIEVLWSGGRGHLNLTTGVRFERDVARAELYRRDIHVEGDLEQAIGSTQSVKMSWFYQWRGYRRFSLDKWHELDSALEYKWSPHLAVAFTTELSNDPSFLQTTKLFFGGSLRYFFSPSNYLGLRVGENRPGLKCLNGLCRYYPPFAGVRVLAVARF